MIELLKLEVEHAFLVLLFKQCQWQPVSPPARASEPQPTGNAATGSASHGASASDSESEPEGSLAGRRSRSRRAPGFARRRGHRHWYR